MPGRTPISLQRLPNATGALGEFNRLSQHLNYGGVVWEERRGGYKSRQVGQRCVRRAALRSING